jgi:nucleotide-binding universal stress UspA family protein
MSDSKLAHIICAVEPNDEAHDVVNMAAHVAAREGSDLTLIHVVPPMWQPYADLNFTPIIEAQVALEEDLLKTARAKLNELITSAATSSACVIVVKGDPVSTIVEHAEELGDALIVMGVHNRRGLHRLLGSTAHGVLNATDKPILLVHADDHETTCYDNVLVAVDTSAAMHGVLEHAAPYIKQAKQHKVISVVQSLAMTLGSLQASAFAPNLGQISDLQRELVDAVKGTVNEAATNAELDTECIKVIEGDPAHEICAAAQAQKADLIIMGSGQRNILDRILLGSTAHGVLNNSPCDVYIAR